MSQYLRRFFEMDLILEQDCWRYQTQSTLQQWTQFRFDIDGTNIISRQKFRSAT